MQQQRRRRCKTNKQPQSSSHQFFRRMKAIVVVLLLLTAVFGQVCLQQPCIDIVDSDSSSVSDPSDVVTSGSSSMVTGQTLFVSERFVYQLASDQTSVGIQATAALGQYGSRATTVGSFLGSNELLTFVVPDKDTSKLHVLSISGNSLSDYQAPIKLPPLPQGTKFTTATILTNELSSNVEKVFFFSASTALVVCFNQLLPGSYDGASVLNLTASFGGNPLGANFAVNSGEFQSSGYLFVSRLIGDALLPGEILTLKLAPGCKLQPLQSTYITPAPIGLTLQGGAVNGDDRLYWLANANANSAARLFQWDVRKQQALNATVKLAAMSLWSEMGVAQTNYPLMSFGLVADQIPGASNYTLHLVYLNPIVPYYSRSFPGLAPTASQSVDSAYGYTVLSRRDSNNIHHFDLVRTSPPPLPPHLSASDDGDAIESKQRPSTSTYANATHVSGHRLRSCPGSSFGVPPTCQACTAPGCICGQTLKCPKPSCCFIVDETVMCCQTSPPVITPPFICGQ